MVAEVAKLAQLTELAQLAKLAGLSVYLSVCQLAEIIVSDHQR